MSTCEEKKGSLNNIIEINQDEFEFPTFRIVTTTFDSNGITSCSENPLGSRNDSKITN